MKSTFKCSKNNDCEINQVTRTSCQACRFEKCIRVGMSKNGKNTLINNNSYMSA